MCTQGSETVRRGGHQQLRVLKESLEDLPAEVEQVSLRSDTAGYQKELLKYCAEGRSERFGVIEFAVGVDVTTAFKKAVSETAADEWKDLYRKAGEHAEYTGQQYAEVCFVPNWVGHSLNGPEYRYVAIRELLRMPTLPGMEAQLKLSVPIMEMADGAWYKVTGIVTNRDLPGDELIRRGERRCGKGEEVHSVLKQDLAGGRMPFRRGEFGVNAAWWAISVLAFNLNSAIKQLALGSQWVSKRLGAIRFGIINLPGRVVRHARRLIIRLPRGHPSSSRCSTLDEERLRWQTHPQTADRPHNPTAHIATQHRSLATLWATVIENAESNVLMSVTSSPPTTPDLRATGK